MDISEQYNTLCKEIGEDVHKSKEMIEELIPKLHEALNLAKSIHGVAAEYTYIEWIDEVEKIKSNLNHLEKFFSED